MADLIDRQELLKHKGNCYDEEGHLLYAVGTGTILLMPTVDAEPVKHGRWVEYKRRYGWYCSQCKKENNFAYDYNENNVIELQDHYCPNCGAKMDEVEE